MEHLEKLEKDLYGDDSEKLSQRMRRRVVFPPSLRKQPTSWGDENGKLLGDKKNTKLAILLKVGISVFILFLILLGSTFVFLYLGTKGSEAEVIFQKKGPIEAGAEVTVPVTFRNTSRSVLSEVEITFIAPKDSLLVEGGIDRPVPSRIIRAVEDLPPGGERTEEVTLKFFGQEGEEVKVEAVLLYKPESLRARFSSKAEGSFVISKVPIGLSLANPEILANGQNFETEVRVTSNSVYPFDNTWLRLEYPPGFSFSSADPSPEVGDTIWKLGSLEPGDEKTIKVVGTIDGEEGEVKAFQAELGVFDVLTKEWRKYRHISESAMIRETPLSLQVSLNNLRGGILVPGDRILGKVLYRNNTSFFLRNLTVSVYLEGGILDFSTLEIQKGVLESGTRRLIWSPASANELRELAPGQGGEVLFNLKTRERPAVRTDADKNQTVRARAEVTTGSVPEELSGTDLSSQDSVEFKVRSKVVFVGKSLFRSTPILNSGPLPPKIGSKTTYTIFWEIRNFTNNLRDISVVSFLPPNVVWESQMVPNAARTSYDSTSGQIRWVIGELPAGVGVTGPALTLFFKVSITPSEADLGKAMVLLGETKFEGFDDFAKIKIEERVSLLTTELVADPLTNASEWSVVK